MFIERRQTLGTKAPEGRHVTNSEIIAEEGERENEKMGRREVHYSLPSLVREDPSVPRPGVTGAGGHRGVKTLHHRVIFQGFTIRCSFSISISFVSVSVSFVSVSTCLSSE